MTLKKAYKAYGQGEYGKAADLLKEEYEIVKKSGRYESTILRRLVEDFSTFHNVIPWLYVAMMKLDKGKESINDKDIKVAFEKNIERHSDDIKITRRLLRIEKKE